MCILHEQTTDEQNSKCGVNNPPTAWQHAFRVGILPQVTTDALRGLQEALLRDDPRVVTGATMNPPPLQFMQHEPVGACCPLCWLLLDRRKPHEVSVGPLEERFAEACYRADQLLGEPAGVRYFLQAVDEWSREELIRNLLPEVDLALSSRQRKGRQ